MTVQVRPLFNMAPFFLIIAYLSLTVLFFFFGPINWHLDNTLPLALFLTATFLCMGCGYLLGISGGFSASNNRWSIRLFVAGCLSSLIIFFPAVYVYTHKLPWQIMDVLSFQGEAYKNMLEILSGESADRKIVALCRMLLAPLTFTVIPLAILCWSKLRPWQILIFLAYIVAQLIFSLMRGTDKEIADLLILVASAGLISLGRYYIRGGRLPRLRTLLMLSVLGICILMSAFSLFSERKMARLGGAKEFCMVNSASICASYDGPILSLMSEQNKFGMAMLSTYMSHGYYGLYLALNEPFESMFGLGHSYILTSLYAKIADDDEFYSRSYLSKIKREGWDDMSVWSSLFPWIANDISFIGVPFFMGLLAFVLAKTWRSATYGFDNIAAVVFTMLLLLFIYAPANNQLAQTADMYYGFWFWIVLWASKALLSNGRLYVRI